MFEGDDADDDNDDYDNEDHYEDNKDIYDKGNHSKYNQEKATTANTTMTNKTKTIKNVSPHKKIIMDGLFYLYIFCGWISSERVLYQCYYPTTSRVSLVSRREYF